MTPTPEQVAQWAREAGDGRMDSRGRVTFTFDSYGVERFATLACAWQAEQDIDTVAFHGGSVEIEAAIRANAPKGTT